MIGSIANEHLRFTLILCAHGKVIYDVLMSLEYVHVACYLTKLKCTLFI